MGTLVSPSDTSVLLAILTSIAAGALWAEQRFEFARKLTGCMVALLAGMVLSNAHVIPSDAPALDLVWGWAVPLALPLLLLQANLVRIFRETGPTLAAFVVGAIGSVLGGVLASQVVPLGPDTWKATGVFVGTYIGGAINFVAISRAVDLPGDITSAAVAADNLVMTLYFFVLIAAARSARLHRWFARGKVPGGPASDGAAVPSEASARPAATLTSISAALAIAFAVSGAGGAIAKAVELPHLSILFVTALAVALATLFPSRAASLGGGEEIGVFLMHVFFVAIGAAANVPVIVRSGPLLFAMAGMVIATHMVFLLLVCRLMRLPLDETLVASNANIGGPTTASAFAVGLRWNRLVLPAVLSGILGYVVATYVGLGVAHLVR